MLTLKLNLTGIMHTSQIMIHIILCLRFLVHNPVKLVLHFLRAPYDIDVISKLCIQRPERRFLYIEQKQFMRGYNE